MPQHLLPFQDTVCTGVVERLLEVEALYRALPADADDAQRERIRQCDGAIVLQAPTGAGKTLLATEALGTLSARVRALWFWFAPFAGLVEQAANTLRAQVPQLPLLDLASDRRLDAVGAGGVFVTTWQSVATAKAGDRRARVGGDAGVSLDVLIAQARRDGVRIGCVVDEAHHGFHKARETRAFFTSVLKPDFTLMLTATPRDADVAAFERDTGYRVGDPDRWASVSRRDAVDAGLLKRGVKLVRYVARNENDAELVDFERTALRQCAEMHRAIAARLRERGIVLTPLMLVQVPDGEAAQKAAREYLVGELGFAESAVRLHTAKEPDPDLIALAADPGVEVLIFKMAVALGFDAPRAFSLAALRGARDRDFGIQVIGRIVRVHPLLRHRDALPPELDYGYVFLANAQAQEGLLAAGQQIEALSTQAPELGTQTVVTLIGARSEVQVLKSGETASLLIDAQGAHALNPDGSAGEVSEALDAFKGATQESLFGAVAGGRMVPLGGTGTISVTAILSADAARQTHYRRRAQAPERLVSEYLPPADASLEQRVVDHVDFSPAVLASMHQAFAKLLRIEKDVFGGIAEDRESYELAALSPARIAERVERQLALFVELDQRALFSALSARFCDKLADAGFSQPDNEEALDHALDLVLARHPRLMREAFKLARMDGVGEREVELPLVLASAQALAPAKRNVYGVMPATFDSADEAAMAAILDDFADVLWWHRNPSRTDALVLYRWDDGAAFHPDFVVGFRARESRDQIALLEVKGPHLWGKPSEVAKAKGPAHRDYGRCVFVGREKKEPFKLLRAMDNALVPYADFDPAQLRWIER